MPPIDDDGEQLRRVRRRLAQRAPAAAGGGGDGDGGAAPHACVIRARSAASDDERFWALCGLQRAALALGGRRRMPAALALRVWDVVVRRLSECVDEVLRAALVLLATLLEYDNVTRDSALRAQPVARFRTETWRTTHAAH